MTPLTRFLLALHGADKAKLANADPVKLAARYGVREQDVRGYLKMEGV